MTAKIEAWHFSAADCRLGYGDGRLIVAGETLTVAGPVALCEHGLHASRDIRDALVLELGPYIWRVELSGEIVEGNDKLVATKRTALWGYNATEVLRGFARRCALSVVDLWDAPAIVRRYLETGDESIRAAAWAAAWDAAGDAARATTAEAAARAAAWAAARAAAGDAARATTARATAEAAQGSRLEEMVLAGREQVTA